MEILETFAQVFYLPKSPINENGGNCFDQLLLYFSFIQVAFLWDMWDTILIFCCHVTPVLPRVLCCLFFKLSLPCAQQFWNTKSDGEEQQNVEIFLWLWAAFNEEKLRNKVDGQKSNRNYKKKKAKYHVIFFSSFAGKIC